MSDLKPEKFLNYIHKEVNHCKLVRSPSWLRAGNSSSERPVYSRYTLSGFNNQIDHSLERRAARMLLGVASNDLPSLEGFPEVSVVVPGSRGGLLSGRLCCVSLLS